MVDRIDCSKLDLIGLAERLAVIRQLQAVWRDRPHSLKGWALQEAINTCEHLALCSQDVLAELYRRDRRERK